MEGNGSIVLSGRTLTSRQAIAMSESSPYHSGEVDDGQQPLVGDLRISATIDPSVRTAGGGWDGNGKRTAAGAGDGRGAARPSAGAWRGETHPPCQGVVIASIFDGVCWQRLDVGSITRSFRFNNCTQLTAVLRWVRTAVANSAGRVCTARPADRDRGLPSAYILTAATPDGGPDPAAADRVAGSAGAAGNGVSPASDTRHPSPR